jgi:BirA family transcriptional regulator, biotin operon repressor / biotin---[acetyl-CoA-carboxylase] ligase
MNRAPCLPPVYEARAAATDPLDEALALAREGAAEGLLSWRERDGLIELAVLLAPEVPLPRALEVMPLAQVALGDAIGALAPPGMRIDLRWPDRLLVEGAEAARLRLARVGDSDPPWLVLGLALRHRHDPREGEPGHDPGSTSLAEEGFRPDAVTLIEAFARHLLAWANTWQERGFGPVRASWLSRAARDGASLDLVAGGDLVSGGRRLSLAEALGVSP